MNCTDLCSQPITTNFSEAFDEAVIVRYFGESRSMLLARLGTTGDSWQPLCGFHNPHVRIDASWCSFPPEGSGPVCHRSMGRMFCRGCLLTDSSSMIIV